MSILLVATCMLGCAGHIADARFSGADSWPLSAGLIGGTPAVALHGTPFDRNSGAFYEPLGYAFGHDGQTDIYHSLGVTVAVLHGVPPWLDPLRPVAPGPANWEAMAPIGSTRVYRAGGDPKTMLLVRSSATWLYVSTPCNFCDGVPMEQLLTLERAGEPSSLPAPPPGAFASSLTLYPQYGPDLPFTLPYWFREPSSVTAADFVVYPVAANGWARSVLTLTYSSAASSTAEANDLNVRMRTDPRERDRERYGTTYGPVGGDFFAGYDGAYANGNTLTVTGGIGASFRDFLSWVWTGQ